MSNDNKFLELTILTLLLTVFFVYNFDFLAVLFSVFFLGIAFTTKNDKKYFNSIWIISATLILALFFPHFMFSAPLLLIAFFIGCWFAKKDNKNLIAKVGA